MKKTLLCSAMFNILCAPIYADTTPSTSPQTQAQPTQIINQQTTPAQTQSTQQTPTQEVAPVVIINCDYKIPASTKTIDQSLIITWAEKATTQAFDFDPESVDSQLEKLQACFTDQGWEGFNNALKTSGNIDAIRSQKLNVSSQVDGKTEITEAKDNQWKVSLPLQVVYQNDKEKVTQLLSVNLTIGRKPTGDLGITQMIATPRKKAEQSTKLPNSNTGSTEMPAETNPPAPK